MHSISEHEKSTTIKLVYAAMLIALSFIGSLIKIQGTIALDSMAGFFASLFLGPALGSLVGALGHILTAFTSGFPLTLPIHIIITLQMAVAVYLFGFIYKKTNGVIAIVSAVILNGPLAVLVLSPITKALDFPLNGKAFVYAMIVPLTLASIVNIVLAYIIFKRTSKGQCK